MLEDRPDHDGSGGLLGAVALLLLVRRVGGNDGSRRIYLLAKHDPFCGDDGLYHESGRPLDRGSEWDQLSAKRTSRAKCMRPMILFLEQQSWRAGAQRVLDSVL